MKRRHIVCHCNQTTFKEIEDAINSGSIRFEDIQRDTGTSTGCGRCSIQVRQILKSLLI